MRTFNPAIVVGLSAGLVLSSSIGAAAQESAVDAEHPFVGAWIVDPTPSSEVDADAMLLAGPGGILLNSSPDGLAFGAWAPADGDTALFTFVSQVQDAGSGFIMVRASVDVTPDGDGFFGTYTVELPGADGVTQEYGPEPVAGDRIGVEEMGTPVGPVP